MTVRLVDYLVKALSEHGVRHVFGVGGANIEDVYDAIFRADGPIRGIVAKHEFSAVTMADGYARVSNRLGVVMATSGGGMTNLVSGLAEAHASRIPVLALVGQPPTTLAGKGAFQDSSGLAGSMDALRLLSPVSRFCVRVTEPESITELLPAAIAAACGQPGGPAVLLLPKDVQQSLISPVPGTPVRPPVSITDSAERARAVRALSAAGRRVLIIAGEGVARAEAKPELAVLANVLGAGVAVSPDAKDVFDNTDPRFVGVAGVMGHVAVGELLRQAEVCLLVGTRLPMMASGGLMEALSGTQVVCLDPEPPHVDGIHLAGDLRAELLSLISALDHVPRLPPQVDRTSLHSGQSYRDAVAAIGDSLPDNAHVFVDAGNTGAAAIHLLNAPRQGRFVVAIGMGGMGYTFGAGIGAALPTGRRTYVIAGDGAFFMHGMEMHTAVEYDVPVTFVIFNNNAHAMCATRERLYYSGDYSYNLFQSTDIAAGVAAMFPKLATFRARSASELADALAATNDSGLPACVCMDFDPLQTPPFLPFLAEQDRETPHERVS